eukprot:gene18665-33929_t
MPTFGFDGDGSDAADNTTGEDVAEAAAASAAAAAAAAAVSDQSGCCTIKNPVCCFKKCVGDQSGILVDQEEAEEEKQKIWERWVVLNSLLNIDLVCPDNGLINPIEDWVYALKFSAAKMKAALAVNKADVTAKTVQDIEHHIAALYRSAGIDKGFVETFLGLSCGMKTFQLINYAMTTFDVIDGGLDFVAVYELAQYRETVPHAVWLAGTTVITLVVQLKIKVGVWTKQSASTKAGQGFFDLSNTDGRANFIMCCAVLEVAIFLIEDATTLFIFWQTGLFGSSAATAANLYFSLASGMLALLGFVYGLFRFIQTSCGNKDITVSERGIPVPRSFNRKNRLYLGDVYLGDGTGARVTTALGVTLFISLMVFILGYWCWFAFGVINEGAFYNCIGGCATKADAVAEHPALFAALAEALDRTVQSLSIADAEMVSVAAATFFEGLSPDCNTTAFGNVDGSGEEIVVVSNASNASNASNSSLAAFGFGSHTAKDESVNEAVLALYIFGWFFAMLWATAVANESVNKSMVTISVTVVVVGFCLVVKPVVQSLGSKF